MGARYAGRVVLITGAAQGLGHAMATRFADEGARVAACDINPDPLENLASSAAVTASVVDVRDPGQVSAWIRKSHAALERIDVLVNNAGVIRDGRVEALSDDDWNTVIDVSLRGMFNCSRAVVPIMKDQQYGRILSFSSMSGRGNFGQANYAAAKAGVVGMARTLALEGARHGITSNVIAPGLIDTPMLASMNAAARDKLAARVPVGHIGRPADIAEAATYLCSEQAGYVTGVVLDVDGGITIGSSLR